jgi:membrane fusion protein, multidrug efflux system
MRIAKILLLVSPTILALLLLGAHWLGNREQASEAEREAPVHKAFALALEDGVTTLTVDVASQVRSGIRTAVLAHMQAPDGAAVYGTVVDLQPLFEMAGRYLAGGTELRAAQAELGQRDAELKRVQALYDDTQNVSRKALDAARTDVTAARARADAARAGSAATAAALRQQFGDVVAGWALAAAPDMAALANRKAVLVRVAPLPAGSAAPRRLLLAGDADGALAARLVSAAPQVDPALQGKAYFYRVDAPLAAGTRLAGQVDSGQRAGLRIPPDAIVWYGGQPWAYVRTAPDRFERRAVGQAGAGDGAFVAVQGFTAGDAVVVQGAQLLLSEESRALLGND